jgi:DNA-directed RNA polymerase specialized sigma subunit
VWKSYRYIIKRYPRISLAEERNLIKKAQGGSKKSKNELVLRYVGFLIFRIYKIAFPSLIRSFGEDLLAEAILIVYKKIESYDLNYCDKHGNPRPVKFTSYIWKRIDGFIIDSLKKELNESNYYDRYSGYALKNGDLSSMSESRITGQNGQI